MKTRALQSAAIMILAAFNVSAFGEENCEEFVTPTGTVAIHISETTKTMWDSLGPPHNEWKMWHIYGFLMEAFRSDGTPFDIVSDADIDAGLLMNGGVPQYTILFSLANDCISDSIANKIKAFVFAGGHAFVGSTSWTRDENGILRSSGTGPGSGIYTAEEITVNAENYFKFWEGFPRLPEHTIDNDCESMWVNAIDDDLPTWIQYEFPNVHTISKVALAHCKYGELSVYKYLIRDYEIQVSTVPGGPDGSFVTVATNTGGNIVGEYQETTFAPTQAKCIRINILSGYETEPFSYDGVVYDTTQWVALNSFQAFEDVTDNSMIDHSCGETGPAENLFALSSEMGLLAGVPILIGDLKRTGVDSPLVSHLEDDEVVRGWKLARNAGASSFNHPVHWALQVQATTATVLATTSNGDPILTTNRYGNGRFIYHSEFNPLAGYSSYTVANYIYGVYRKAIDEAHKELSYPNVRLGAWPWPYVAGFITNHDHFTNFGFDGIPDTEDDNLVTKIEASRSVHGFYTLRTNVALPDNGETCTNPVYGQSCDESIRINLLVMEALGAEIGSHTTDETQEPSQANVAESLDRLEAFLGYRPMIFDSPGGSGMRDTTKEGLVNEGIIITGDIVGLVPLPHFAVRIDTATEYDDAARWPLIEIPSTGYYSTPNSGAFAGGIFSHEITSNPPGCNNDGTVRPCMEKAVDLQYSLGGIINLYDHIGDSSLTNPDPEQFAAYIDYAQSLPYVHTTSALDIYQWWIRRDLVRLSTTYTADPNPQITIEVSCAEDSGPFSVEVDLPWPGGADVIINSIISEDYVLEGNRIRVKTPVPSQIVLTPAPVCRGSIKSDLNSDCKVDLSDFMTFAGQWLDCQIEPLDFCWTH